MFSQASSPTTEALHMNLEQLLPYLIFASITSIVIVVASLMNDKSKRTSQRLEELKNPLSRKGGKKEEQTVFQKAAPTLSKALQPKTEIEQSELRIRLSNAGFHSPNAITIYLAIKFVALLGGLLLGAGYGIPNYGMTQSGLFAIVIGGGLGFYIPEIGLWFIKRTRQEKIFLSMPDALDLLVVCVEAGLGLDQGMRRVSEELIDTHPELCAELNMSLFQTQMGRQRREVLHDLGVRTGVDDMRALAAILIQADKFGSSVAQALRVQSDSMRVKRMQMAEEKAAQTAVKMIFPLVLFIFPGIFVVLVGPAAIMMIDGLLAT